LSLRPPPRVRLSHRAHLARGARCADCHGVGSPTRPVEARCAGCHSVEDPRGCVDCHLADATGRLITQGPRGALLPQDHAAPGFATQHRADPRCAACHAERDCLACHAGRLKPPSIHPMDYLSLHASDARARRLDCGRCHAHQACVDCHLKAGLTDGPRPHGAPFHPPGFIGAAGDAPSAAHHRHEARADLQRCVGCHTEATCLRCHSAQPGAARRISPHPLDFRAGCRMLNPRSCLKCHRSTQELDRLCGR
ncbi:hypothetical protein KJ940_06330, partial [Myxococcota bacterium]|nr:hypothetical protein [Myxococcota bacterium]